MKKTKKTTNKTNKKKYNWVYVRIPRQSIITESSTSLLIKLGKYEFWFNKDYATNSEFCLTTSLSIADGFDFEVGGREISGSKLVDLIEKEYPEYNQHSDEDEEDEEDWEEDLK